jgi:hypothetical protein
MKNLAVFLAVLGMSIAIIAVSICQIWIDSNTAWVITFSLVGVTILLLVSSLILFYNVDRIYSFKSRFSYKKVLIILPFIFLLSSCSTTTNVCNLRNGKNVKIQKSGYSYNHNHKSIW